MKITGETIFIHVPSDKQSLVFAWKRMLLTHDVDLKTRIMELIEIDSKYLEEKYARKL